MSCVAGPAGVGSGELGVTTVLPLSVSGSVTAAPVGARKSEAAMPGSQTELYPVAVFTRRIALPVRPAAASAASACSP